MIFSLFHSTEADTIGKTPQQQIKKKPTQIGGLWQ